MILTRYHPFLLALSVGITGIGNLVAQEEEAAETAPLPIKALLVSGGCCHDYENQNAILTAGIRERIMLPIEWKVRYENSDRSDLENEFFENEGWAEGYDIVIHNYCYPRVRDPDFVEKITAPHRSGTPAILLHGAMHSFRTGNDDWFHFCGVTSRGHDRAAPFQVNPLEDRDEITEGMTLWTTPRGELYRIEKIWQGTEILTDAMSSQTDRREPTSWKHRYGPAETRIFATSVGNDTETVAHAAHLDHLARGFLWALSQPVADKFRKVAPDDSLTELSLPEMVKPPLHIGNSISRIDHLSALSENEADGHTIRMAFDQNLETSWQSATPGVNSILFEVEKATEVGAILILWHDLAPLAFSISGSDDGLDWETIWEEAPTDGAVLSVAEMNVDHRHYRLDILRTARGVSPAIREIALYNSLDAVPAALLLDRPLAAEKAISSVGLRTKGAQSDGATSRQLPDNFAVETTIETASGGAFVIGSGVSAGRSVYFLDPGSNGLTSKTPFLADLSANASIAWDGEWIYLLDNAQLTKYRDTNRDGVADERHRLGSLLTFAEEEQPVPVELDNLVLGLDGKLIATVTSPRAQNAFSNDGSLLRIPESSFLRFDRDGSGMKVIAAKPKEKKSNDRPEKRKPVVLDTIPDPELAALFSSPDPIVRRETRFEILRRKRVPYVTTEEALQNAATPAGQVAALYALADDDSAQSLLLLSRESREHPARSVRIAAFRRLAQFPGAKNLKAFEAIASETDPEVTAAIIEAILATGSSFDGLDRLVLEFASSKDPVLSETAIDFLVRRDARQVCLDALASDLQASLWVPALRILEQIPSVSVVEGLVEQISETRSPELRNTFLQNLAKLHQLDGLPWEGTPLVVAGFSAALKNIRVDKAHAFTLIIENQIPHIDVDAIVSAGQESPGYEPAAIALLEGRDFPKSAGEWLFDIADHNSRAESLRMNALGLLAATTDKQTLEEVFTRLAVVTSHDHGEAAREESIRRWISNPEIRNLEPFLSKQIKSSREGASILAWRSILSLAERDAATPPLLALLAEPPSRNLISALSLQSSRLAPEILERGSDVEGAVSVAEKLAIDLQTGKPLLPISTDPVELEKSIADFEGDYESGWKHFQRLGCVRCHNIHGEGPHLGPDLAAAVRNQSRTELIQSILSPHESVVDGFEPVLVTRKDGRVIRGFVQRDSSEDHLLISDRGGNSISLSAEEIAQKDVLTGSVMPDGFEKKMSTRDFSDLMVFLQSLAAP